MKWQMRARVLRALGVSDRPGILDHGAVVDQSETRALLADRAIQARNGLV